MTGIFFVQDTRVLTIWMVRGLDRFGIFVLFTEFTEFTEFSEFSEFTECMHGTVVVQTETKIVVNLDTIFTAPRITSREKQRSAC